MEVVINQTVKKFDVQLTSNPKRFEVVVSSNSVSIVVEMATLGKQGMPGLSNYQLAVKNGTFVGTEEEYLASLKGAPGDLTPLGNYERDWAQDFLIAFNT